MSSRMDYGCGDRYKTFEYVECLDFDGARQTLCILDCYNLLIAAMS
jgi:hypothetical protein